MYCLDEFKFWTEVFSEYMEWDESSARRIAQKYRDELREQIQESNDIIKTVNDELDRQNAEDRKIAEAMEQEYNELDWNQLQTSQFDSAPPIWC